MSLPAFVAGGLGWMASEYLIHRYSGHGPKRTRPARLIDRISLAGLAAEPAGAVGDRTLDALPSVGGECVGHLLRIAHRSRRIATAQRHETVTEQRSWSSHLAR